MNFKRYKCKMLFYLSSQNIARFLTGDAPKLKEDEHGRQAINMVDVWKHFDFLRQDHKWLD